MGMETECFDSCGFKDRGSATYTPEYYAVKHYSHYVTPGSKVLAYKDRGTGCR